MEQIKEITVHTEWKDITLNQLKEMYESRDIITDPDYQRKYVYNDKQASRLIESILIGIPIPVVYLCEEDDNVYTVIDGQQRITSFVRYLRNDFPLVGLITMPQYNGRYFRDLEKSVQRRLKSKALRAVCLDKDSQELKYEIFSRLNLGAVKLKDQELRNCIYRGPFNDMLKDIASNNQVLKLLFHDDNMHSAYEERILRFFALRNYLETQGTFKVTMNRYMAKHQFDSETELQKMKNKYNGLIDLIKQVLGENAFYSLSNNQRKQFNGAVYDSIVIAFSYFPKHLIMQNADQIRTSIEYIKHNDTEYQNNVYVGTNSGARVRGRISKIIESIDRIVSKDSLTDRVRLFTKTDKENLFYTGCICAYCGNRILNIDDCEIDHIIPFSLGGPTNLENAQLLHRHCNRSKGNKMMPLASQEDMIDNDVDEEGTEQ